MLCPDGILDPQRVIETFQANPNCTILTFTNAAANSLNSLIASSLFKNAQALGYFQLDSDTDLAPIYKSMRVMITQNRDKSQNVVNGQMATVEMCHNATVILKLPGNKLVATYPVTCECGSTHKTVYPFWLGYANTMCKAKDQTLPKAILWFDQDIIPAGTAYVALSRVQKLSDVLFLTPLKTSLFKPVLEA